MTNPLSKQRGLTFLSTIIILVFILFQGVIALNVIPVYMTDSSVKSIMKNLPTDMKAKQANPLELKRIVEQRLSVNSVYNVKPEHIKVKKGRSELIVLIEYEPRGKLIGNLEFIVSFKHEARVQQSR